MQSLLTIVTLLSMIFLDLRLPQLKVCKTAVKFKQGKCEPSILALQSYPCYQLDLKSWAFWMHDYFYTDQINGNRWTRLYSL